MDTAHATHGRRSSGAISKVVALLVIVGFAAVALATPPAVPDDVPLEYRVKATFLFKFFDFVAWPADGPTASIDAVAIGVVGDGPIVAALRDLEGQEVNGRPLVVRDLTATRDLGSCHILFFSDDGGEDVAGILAELSGAPVLTVGESDDFISRGGMIRFFLEAKKVRFEVSTAAYRRAGLKISSQLLRLATIFEEHEGG